MGYRRGDLLRIKDGTVKAEMEFRSWASSVYRSSFSAEMCSIFSLDSLGKPELCALPPDGAMVVVVSSKKSRFSEKILVHYPDVPPFYIRTEFLEEVKK